MGKLSVGILASPVLAAATLFLIITSEMSGTGPAFAADAPVATAQAPAYAGSKSCRECHERFYGLWSTSFHGLAMQQYTETLAKEKLTLQKDDVVIGKNHYRAEIGAGYVLETGPDGKGKKYRVEYALGGKDIAKLWSSWYNADEGLKFWAGRLGYVLCQQRGGTDCVKPEN